jgi:hypothetical protein
VPQFNPSLVATCQASVCGVADITTLDLSACTMDAECILRLPYCCGCSATGTPPIAIRMDERMTLDVLLCGPDGCTEHCDPLEIHPGFVARCDATTHHCAAVATGP